MSDDEDLIYVKKQKTIHYGSLEDTERARLAALATKAEPKEEDSESSDDSKSDEDEKPAPTKAPENSGQIHISNGNTLYILIIYNFMHMCLNFE